MYQTSSSTLDVTISLPHLEILYGHCDSNPIPEGMQVDVIIQNTCSCFDYTHQHRLVLVCVTLFAHKWITYRN
ncbi:hypothetical protein AQUCO_05900004v1 [Aquilegia coerulea]|uniref:Uncharacterized protein n=1 Tax=Aquilegia coerulea TaxID=218851 RepID=A0A2G5CDY2_AQUCA|nr:hypothetical protein AQUCO_05900004v1 [Aquilegia coerulea]